MLFYVLKLIIGLVLTIAVEVFVAYIMGFHKKIELKAVALVSLITYPILNLLIYIYLLVFHDGYLTILTAVLEVGVVIAEYLLLRYALGNKYNKWRLPTLSFVMNLCSYLLGLLLLQNLFI